MRGTQALGALVVGWAVFFNGAAIVAAAKAEACVMFPAKNTLINKFSDEPDGHRAAALANLLEVGIFIDGIPVRREAFVGAVLAAAGMPMMEWRWGRTVGHVRRLSQERAGRAGSKNDCADRASERAVSSFRVHGNGNLADQESCKPRCFGERDCGEPVYCLRITEASAEENPCSDLPYDARTVSVVLHAEAEEQLARSVPPLVAVMDRLFDQHVWSIQGGVSDFPRSLRDISLANVHSPLEESEGGGQTCGNCRDEISDLETGPEVARRWNWHAVVLPVGVFLVLGGMACAVLSEKCRNGALRRVLLIFGGVALCGAPIAVLIGWATGFA